MKYRSGNPALNIDTFNKLAQPTDGKYMTLNGVAVKSFILLAICFVGGFIGWQFADIVMLVYSMPSTTYEQSVALPSHDILQACCIILSIVALILAIIASYKKRFSPVVAPLYALFEGGAIGIISQIYDQTFKGIVIQAIFLTICVFTAMLLLYLFRIIKVTENFKLGIAAATGGIVLYYFASLGLSFLQIQLPLIHDNSISGIIFSLFVVVIAALNLVVDFDFIEEGVRKQVPKYMEWYSSFGLLVTLIWLYLEILRLLAKSRSR